MAQNVRTGFSWLGIVLRFPKNPQLLSASKIGIHQTANTQKQMQIKFEPGIKLNPIRYMRQMKWLY